MLVSPVTGLSFLPAKVEALLGDTLRLPLLAYVEIDGKKVGSGSLNFIQSQWLLALYISDVGSHVSNQE